MSQAGQYRQQITIYSPATPVSDGAGGFVSFGAENGLQRWAKVEAQQGKEVLINGKLVYRQPYKITVRAEATISTSERIEWNGIKLAINSVVPDVRNTEITFNCIVNS